MIGINASADTQRRTHDICLLSETNECHLTFHRKYAYNFLWSSLVFFFFFSSLLWISFFSWYFVAMHSSKTKISILKNTTATQNIRTRLHCGSCHSSIEGTAREWKAQRIIELKCQTVHWFDFRYISILVTYSTFKWNYWLIIVNKLNRTTHRLFVINSIVHRKREKKQHTECTQQIYSE